VQGEEVWNPHSNFKLDVERDVGSHRGMESKGFGHCRSLDVLRGKIEALVNLLENNCAGLPPVPSPRRDSVGPISFSRKKYTIVDAMRR
jgi:hypothetical protein